MTILSRFLQSKTVASLFESLRCILNCLVLPEPLCVRLGRFLWICVIVTSRFLKILGQLFGSFDGVNYYRTFKAGHSIFLKEALLKRTYRS